MKLFDPVLVVIDDYQLGTVTARGEVTRFNQDGVIRAVRVVDGPLKGYEYSDDQCQSITPITETQT